LDVKALLDVDMVALEATEKITLMLDLTAPLNPAQSNRPGQTVQIALDRSGSMRGRPLDAAKGSLMRLIDRLAPQDSFGIVAFDDSALVSVPTKKMCDHHLPSLRKAVKQIATGGSTDISAGYLLALREASRDQASSGATILLISDGHANAGERDPKFFSDVATKAATQKVTTATIGLGEGYDEILLEALAQGGGGSHRFSSNIDEAVGAISAEVDDLLDKAVVNAVLRITPTNAVAGAPQIEVLQRLPHWKDGETYVVQLGDLYGGENRRFVVDIDVPGLASLGLCQIAEITIEYLDLDQRQEVSVSLPVNVNVVPGDVAAGRVADLSVRAERLVLQAQNAKALADEDIKSGNIENASSRLKNAAAHLRHEAALMPANDEKSSESLKILRQEAKEIDFLAQSFESKSRSFSSKMMKESYSKSTRSRKPRLEEKPDESE
jgi:Ca-activated chloride channel family protein